MVSQQELFQVQDWEIEEIAHKSHLRDIDGAIFHADDGEDSDLNYDRIGIHWLAILDYCPYQLYLKFVLGVDDTETEEMVDGIQNHMTMNDKRSEESITLGRLPIITDINKSAKLAITKHKDFHEENYPVECDLMIGIIDSLDIAPDIITINDDKPRPYRGIPYLGHILQISGYAFCVRRSHPELTLPIRCVITDETTGLPFWTHMYDDNDATKVLQATMKIMDIVNEIEIAAPTDNRNKCHKCVLNHSCDKRRDRR